MRDNGLRYDRDDFDDEAWDELCLAKLLYNLNYNRGMWWRVVRKYCGYQGLTQRRDIVILIDRWLIDHPTWVRHQLKKQRPHPDCEVCDAQ